MTSEIGRPHAAIPCITDGVEVDKVRALLDDALEPASMLHWGVAAKRRAKGLPVALDSYGVTIGSIRSAGSVKRPWLRLEPAGDELEYNSPSDLIRSWQKSLEIAVDAKSDEASVLVDAQARAARLFVAIAVAAGWEPVETVVRSRRLSKGSSRFTMHSELGTLFPDPKVSSLLETTSPSYRQLVLRNGMISTTTCRFEHCSNDDVGPIEMMRFIAELPEPVVEELRAEFKRREESRHDPVVEELRAAVNRLVKSLRKCP